MNLTRIGAGRIAEYITRSAGCDLPQILREVQTGNAEAWRVDGGRAYMVTRIEHHDTGRELVVMCFEGRDLKRYAPQIIDKARAAGCGSIRYHSNRPGMGRMLEPLGFKVRETVYSVSI